MATSSSEGSLDVHSQFRADARSITAIFIILLITSLANSAGVGGGAIFLPILQALCGFGLKDATAVSQALITAGSVVSVCINVFKRSPLSPAKPLINFNIALLFTPVVLAGVAVGVLLNSVFPSWLLTILLIILMMVMVVQSFSKARHLWRNETLARLKQQQQHQLHKEPAGPVVPGHVQLPTPAHIIAGNHQSNADAPHLPGNTAVVPATSNAARPDHVDAVSDYDRASNPAATASAASTEDHRLIGVSPGAHRSDAMNSSIIPRQQESQRRVDSPQRQGQKASVSGRGSIISSGIRRGRSLPVTSFGGVEDQDTTNSTNNDLAQPLLPHTNMDEEWFGVRLLPAHASSSKDGGDQRNKRSGIASRRPEQRSAQFGDETSAVQYLDTVYGGSDLGGNSNHDDGFSEDGDVLPDLDHQQSSSWVSRRGKWRTHLLLSANELGVVPNESPGLLDALAQARASRQASRQHTPSSQSQVHIAFGSPAGNSATPGRRLWRTPQLGAAPTMRPDMSPINSRTGLIHANRRQVDADALVDAVAAALKDREGAATLIDVQPVNEHPLRIEVPAVDSKARQTLEDVQTPRRGTRHFNNVPPWLQGKVHDLGAQGHLPSSRTGKRLLDKVMYGPPVSRRLPPVQSALPAHDSQDIIRRCDAGRITMSTHQNQAQNIHQSQQPRHGIAAPAPLSSSLLGRDVTGNVSTPFATGVVPAAVSSAMQGMMDDGTTSTQATPADSVPVHSHHPVFQDVQLQMQPGDQGAVSRNINIAQTQSVDVDVPNVPGQQQEQQQEICLSPIDATPGTERHVSPYLQHLRSSAVSDLKRASSWHSFDAITAPGEGQDSSKMPAGTGVGSGRGQVLQSTATRNAARWRKLFIKPATQRDLDSHVATPYASPRSRYAGSDAFTGVKEDVKLQDKQNADSVADGVVVEIKEQENVKGQQPESLMRRIAAVLVWPLVWAFGWLQDLGTVLGAAREVLPGRLMASLLALWAAFSAFQVSRSRVVKCSTGFWGLLAGQLTFMVGIAIVQIVIARRANKRSCSRHTTPTLVNTDAVHLQHASNHSIQTRSSTSHSTAAAAIHNPLYDTHRAGRTFNTDLGVEQTGPHEQSMMHLMNKNHSKQTLSSGAQHAHTTSVITAQEPQHQTATSTGINSAGMKQDPLPTKKDHDAPGDVRTKDDTGANRTVSLGHSPGAGPEPSSISTMVLVVAFTAGVVGGLLGLGGGMLIGPLLLELKTHPQIAAATSTLMVLFSSSAALIGFLMLGRLNVSYSLVLGAASGVASILGVVMVSDLVRRTGRTSIVVFGLSLFILIALLTIASFGFVNMVKDFSQGGDVGFHSLCT